MGLFLSSGFSVWQLLSFCRLFLLASFSVRPRDRFSVPTTVPGRAARTRRQGWPLGHRRRRREAALTAASTARGYFGRAGHRGRSLPVSIKGELAKRLRSFRSNLVFGDLFGSDHDAVMRIGGEAAKGGPNLHERYEGHGWARDTATSDRHRQRLARGGRAPIGLSLGWLHRFHF